MALDTEIVEREANKIAEQGVKGDINLLTAAQSIAKLVNPTRVIFRGGQAFRIVNHVYTIGVNMQGNRKTRLRYQELAVLVDIFSGQNRDHTERSEFHNVFDRKGNIVSTKHHGYAEYRDDVWQKYAQAA